MKTLFRLRSIFRRPVPVAPPPRPVLHLHVHPFTLTPGTVFVHAGAEVTVACVEQSFHGGKLVSVAITTRCKRAITFHRNSPTVSVVL